jgi:trk system potassium uptake protein TrkH
MTATTFLLVILGRRLGLRDRLAIQQSMDTQELSGAKSLITSIIGMTLIFEIARGSFWLLSPFSDLAQARAVASDLPQHQRV